MPFLLKIRPKYFEKNENIPLIYNYKQTYIKEGTRDA